MKFPYLKKEVYKSGSELEERLKQSPGYVSVVLTDNDMNPGKKGIDLIELYSESVWKNVPMILYTGRKDLVSESSLEKAFYCLEKPSNLSEICSVVEKALRAYDKSNSFE